MNIREARTSDMAEIMRVMDAAKRIMRKSGNMHQWADSYPSEDVITTDMERGGAFVVEHDGSIAGYFAFLPSPEPTYDRIYEGQWIDDSLPYHVIHRIASRPDVHGVFGCIMEFCLAREPNIRIDTHRDKLETRRSRNNTKALNKWQRLYEDEHKLRADDNAQLISEILSLQCENKRMKELLGKVKVADL